MRLQDRVAIITGSGGGIGLEYAKRFIREGAKVVVAEIDKTSGRVAARALGPDAEFVATDIAEEESTEAAAAFAQERFGSVDILVNNAALYGQLDNFDNSLGYLRQVFDINLHGQWLMARAVSPAMAAQRWGRIINVASIAAYLHQIPAMMGGEFTELGSWAYAQSKWGVIGQTRLLAGQLGQSNVTVNCIAPGLTMTDATDAVVPTEVQPMFEAMSAMRTNVEPDQLTGAAVFFASEDADLVNGQILCVDGGNVMPV